MLNVEKASNSKHIAICNFPLNLSTDCPFLKRPNNLWCDQCDKSLVPRWHLLSDKERGHGVVWYGFVRCVAYCAKLALPTAQLSNCPNFLNWTVCPLHYHILKKRFLGTLKLQKWHCKKDHSWTLTADHPRFVQTLSSLIFYLAGDLFDMLLPMLSIYQVCIQSKRWIVRISKRGITFHFSSGVCSESSLQSPGSWLYLLQKFTSS